jgi:hypothetical protein
VRVNTGSPCSIYKRNKGNLAAKRKKTFHDLIVSKVFADGGGTHLENKYPTFDQGGFRPSKTLANRQGHHLLC